ncbi:MAG TPA: vitamin K epoxide reductase family protein [Gemmatimonadaceae bacterium]|nr:vitamin K epoxide reductase family protein [Gemmatimonadaceae bacterium]
MTRRMIVAALALAGIFVALYLLLYKLGMIGSLTCSVGSCETVNTSKWATFLGLPVAGWGVGFYVGMFALAIASIQDRYIDSEGMSKVLLLYSGGGLLFSAWLTYLELFVIHAICQWCVVSAVIVTIIFIFCVRDYRSFRKEDESGIPSEAMS